jgi:hypothetical protein
LHNFWTILGNNYQCETAYQLEVIELRQVRAQHSLTLSVNCQARLVVPEAAARRRQRPALQVGQITKNPPKIRLKLFMKLTELYCNSLTNFEHKVPAYKAKIR